MADANVTENQLIEDIEALPPWRTQGDLSDSEGERYREVARIVQQADPSLVASALDQFIARATNEHHDDYEGESKPFLLMRVVFDLPEQAPVEQRRSFKGWTNWPKPDASGQVSLAWPIAWRNGKPTLVDFYRGSMGLPYAASQEYRHMLDHFPFRALGEKEDGEEDRKS
ncbi:MAG TPA: hypothetical protein VF708_19015 [Pyrinomonadaceae bacterium]|jgi:hypothetical protein